MATSRAPVPLTADGGDVRHAHHTVVAADRLRVITTREHLARMRPSPRELFHTAVLVKRAACCGESGLDVIRELMPWMTIWYDHEMWRTGVWVCRVAAPAEPFTGQRPSLLRFHTDMSRYRLPPAYTIIRSVQADEGGGGASLLMHIDDVLARLEQRGDHDDLLAMLRRERLLNTVDPNQPRSALISSHDGHTLARIFDATAATKGLHLDMTADEVAALDRFVDVCHDCDDLVIRPDVEPGDVLAFSNHTFMHARTACAAAGRITEIVLGNAAAA